MHRILILFAAFVFCMASSAAQETNKNKSKDRFREKDPNNERVEVRNVTSLNDKGTEYSPAYYEQDFSIVFVASRNQNGPRDPQTGETYNKLYLSSLDPNKEATDPQRFALEINSYLNEGPVSFSRDGRTMFFTQNNMKNGVQKAGKDKKVHLKIYSAYRHNGGEWSGQQELPFNSDDYSCAHPSLSADGDRLYFSSNRPGGYGGMDIWMSERQGATWGEPVNLGPDINTDKNEVFPYIHVTGSLFFASSGHNSKGGLDLFVVEESDSGEQEVVNLNEPFNTVEDDFGLIMNDDGTRGFFTSNRKNGLGKDDIYSFTIDRSLKELRRPDARLVPILITDAATGQAIQGAEIRVLQPSQQGYAASGESAFNIVMEPIQDNANVLRFQLVRKNADSLGRAEMITSAEGEALYQFTRYRGYLLLVTKPGYRTAEFTYVVEADDEFKPIRIEMRPTGPCYRASGTVTSDVGSIRLANARLAFTNKASGQVTNVRSDVNGMFDLCLADAGAYLVKVERDGFLPETVTVVADAGRTPYNEIRLRTNQPGAPTASSGAPMREGTVLILDNLRFEPGIPTLNQSIVRNLDALYELLMRYPGTEIDLSMHTDTRGDAAANLALSQQRAENAKRYLVTRGVNEKRIRAIGKGETEPRNKCIDGVPCTEEEHKFNARMEVKVRRMGV